MGKISQLWEKIFNYTPVELNKILEKFYAEVRKNDGGHYEPSCLRVMMASIDRFLRQKNYSKSIARDVEFRSSRQVLEGVARVLRENGMGKRPNRARSLSNADIQILWDCGQLGSHNSRSLINTIFWNNCVVFGLRSRKVHHQMQMRDFEIHINNSGRKYVSFDTQGMRKTNSGGLNSKPRPVSPRMYATGGPRCPVRLFNSYVNHRPLE